MGRRRGGPGKSTAEEHCRSSVGSQSEARYDGRLPVCRSRPPSLALTRLGLLKLEESFDYVSQILRFLYRDGREEDHIV